MQRRAFVLLSGGLDSTTCLYKAIHDYCPPSVQPWNARHTMALPVRWVEAVSIDYGQRHIKETEYAKLTCDLLGIPHTILDVGNLLRGDKVMLSRDSTDTVQVPDISYADIRGVSPTYVPFRNGLMLAALTAHAQKWVNDQIDEFATVCGSKEQATAEAKDIAGLYFGAHSEDAQNWAYPDCTPEFIGAMANAIYIGSYQTIRLHTPLQWLMKHEIVSLGSRLEVPFGRTWSCYKGEPKHCGVCPTCRSRKEAFVLAGISDPTEYASDAKKAAGTTINVPAAKMNMKATL